MLSQIRVIGGSIAQRNGKEAPHVQKAYPWSIEKKGVAELEEEVSTLKRSESGLRDREEQFRAFMNYYPAHIYIKNEEGKYVFGNDALWCHSCL